MIVSLIVVMSFLTISYASALNSSNVEKKDSPLYKIRTRKAVGIKLSGVINNIRSKFLGERIFSLPLILYKTKDFSSRESYFCKISFNTDCFGQTCAPTSCIRVCDTVQCTQNPWCSNN